MTNQKLNSRTICGELRQIATTCPALWGVVNKVAERYGADLNREVPALSDAGVLSGRTACDEREPSGAMSVVIEVMAASLEPEVWPRLHHGRGGLERHYEEETVNAYRQRKFCLTCGWLLVGAGNRDYEDHAPGPRHSVGRCQEETEQMRRRREGKVALLCRYPLCVDRTRHATRVCSTLDYLCTTCMCRGHTESACPGKIAENAPAFESLRQIFEAYGDAHRVLVTRKASGPDTNIAYGFLRVPINLGRDRFSYETLWRGRTVEEVRQFLRGPECFPTPNLYGPTFRAASWGKACARADQEGRSDLVQRRMRPR